MGIVGIDTLDSDFLRIIFNFNLLLNKWLWGIVGIQILDENNVVLVKSDFLKDIFKF